jgi:hypothetical protein
VRLLALVLVLFAVSAEAGGRFRRFCSRTIDGRSQRGLSCNAGEPPPSTLLAFMYPNDGNTTPCLCTAPTVYSGQTFALSRTGSATCDKQGQVVTGIANGDMVTCAADQARVERNTAGDLALRLEVGRTNLALRSKEIDNAVYSSHGTPTVTANAGVAPDGTTTADRLQVTACVGDGTIEGRYQSFVTASALHTGSLLVKSYPGAGAQSISVCTFATSPGTCVTCDAVEASWSRCQAATTGVIAEVTFGCVHDTANYNGSSDTGDADVLVWGVQLEAGAWASSFLPTVASAETRGSETATITLAANVPVLGSSALTFESPAGEAATPYGPLLWINGSTRLIYRNSSVRTYDGTNEPAIANGVVALTPKRYSTSWGTAGGFILKNETDAVTAASAFTDAAWTGAAIGLAGVDGVFQDALVARVCVDASRAGCQE